MSLLNHPRKYQAFVMPSNFIDYLKGANTGQELVLENNSW